MRCMVKAIRAYLSESTHQEWSEIKGDYTWYQVLARGIEAMDHFSDKEWVQTLMEKGESESGSF